MKYIKLLSIDFAITFTSQNSMAIGGDVLQRVNEGVEQIKKKSLHATKFQRVMRLKYPMLKLIDLLSAPKESRFLEDFRNDHGRIVICQPLENVKCFKNWIR